MTEHTTTVADGNQRSGFQLFDELPDDEYQALKADIAEHGPLVPLEYDEAGNLLDGHHRLRACRELGIKDYPTVVRRFASDAEREEHIVALNVRRRHLTGAQKWQWAGWFLRRHPDWTDRRISRDIGMSPTTVGAVRRELESAGDVSKMDTRTDSLGRRQPATKPRPAPNIFTSSRQSQRAQAALTELGQDVPPGQLDLKRAERAARDKRTEQQRAAADATPLATADLTILHGPASALELEADSVDLVFTDPPYAAESLPAWSDLAALAARTLKPGGLLVAYSGQASLPNVMSRLGEHLDYWWCYAITHVGAFYQLHARHTQVGWKPVLAYRKPGGDIPPWVNDIVTDGAREKSGHDWQQAESEAAYWIGKLTAPGDLVVDPFVGSGTTAAVAHKLGRRFVGCDTDPLAVQRTKERIA